ncbi:MAG: hypothetical protein IJP02_07360 [Oscillospiraceae bacterium]|nr:hypothetical protein [Oscillospiraceae bacterium]
MSTEEMPVSSQPETPTKKESHRPPALVNYLVILFSIAFLLLFLSYFMQQRQTDQEVIEGLQQNSSAMQSVHALISQNETLRRQLSQADFDYAALEKQTQEQLEEQHRTTLALDWLWRIEREFFQRRYSAARSLMKDFEETGLKDSLPAASLVDPDYRSPLEQYQSMYDQLF